jgi:hypothetical protein
MTTSPRPLEIVAQSNVFAMMPEILPSAVLMEGFFILTMLLYNWLEQRTKFCQWEVLPSDKLAFFLNYFSSALLLTQ